jgi:hypothetical protein
MLGVLGTGHHLVGRHGPIGLETFARYRLELPEPGKNVPLVGMLARPERLRQLDRPDSD